MMRIGLLSYEHLHALSYLSALRAREEIDFVGVADQDPQRGRRLCQEHGVPYVETEAALLDQVDAVIITSANVEHRRMALRAAEAGVHALVEKPIATTRADALAMIAAYDRAGLVLGTAFPCPFSPGFRALEESVAAGELGRPLLIKTTNRGMMPGGFFIQLERSGGGAVIDHTVHVADLLRRLTGQEAIQVYAEIGHGFYHQEWDDSALLTIDYTDGCAATLDCSWSRPRSHPTWGDMTLHVVGERGNASANLFGQHLHLYPASEEKPRWQSWGSDLNGLMIDDFLAAVREGRPPRSTGTDGLRALEVALAAYESARREEPVRIEELA